MEKIKIALVYLLAFWMPLSSFAIDFTGEGSNPAGQREFTNSNRRNRILIEVNAVSGLNLSGLHRVPDTTNLVEFVTLAGGPADNFDPTEIHIKRKTKSGYKTIEYDLEEMIQDSDQNYPALHDGDVVLLEKNASENTLKVLNFIAITLGIISSTLLIRDAIKSN